MAWWGWLHIAVALAHTRPDDVISLPFSAPKSSSYRRNGSSTGLWVYAATYGQRALASSLPCWRSVGSLRVSTAKPSAGPSHKAEVPQHHRGALPAAVQWQSHPLPLLTALLLGYIHTPVDSLVVSPTVRYAMARSGKEPVTSRGSRRLCGKTRGCSAAFFGISIRRSTSCS